ncbi:uncharacterized protein LOC142234766 [Haematobia irritans]|uniref:uncharacterized protein LOC142234766 n=1 Tax=Haematobia irritans TaxID=7368 RepID=UPI003F4F6CB9
MDEFMPEWWLAIWIAVINKGFSHLTIHSSFHVGNCSQNCFTLHSSNHCLHNLHHSLAKTMGQHFIISVNEKSLKSSKGKKNHLCGAK